ncbi:MAG: protein kinase domain-containing protein [Wenzhouxiangella sp.]
MSRPPSPERLARLEALFHEALNLPPEKRPAWVDQQLADQPDQAALLKDMLLHDEAETAGLTEAVEDFRRDASGPRDRSGEKIDRYRLLSRIRYGGMAEVYRAARDDGQFDHEVALKVVRSDRVRPALNQLFAAERALMASLNHPHITRIYDGGTTAQGEAYFVMELLNGQPLPAALEQHGLDRSAILGHLGDLCAALGYLHGQLVIHRDIKPENVLLCQTPTGLTVKLLDFGIAAQLDAGLKLQDADQAFAHASGWQSPGYTAPEALDERPCTTAADIYSLGKLILDCTSPLEGRDRAELIAIGEHASQPDPERRYAGVAAMAEDLGRMQRLEPISLFRQRRMHVLGRALQRNGWAVAAGIVLVIAASVWLLRETELRQVAEQALVQAESERDRAASMRDFLLNAFNSSNPRLNQGEEPRLSDLVIGQLELLESATELGPEARIDLLETFGDLARHLGRRELSNRAFEQARTLLEDQGRQHSLEWIGLTSELAGNLSEDGLHDRAVELFASGEAALDRLPDPLDRARAARFLYANWGASEQRRGQHDEAERLTRLALATTPTLQAAGEPDLDDTFMLVTLGARQSSRRDYDGALETFKAALRAHRSQGHERSFEELALLGWIGITKMALDQPEAEHYLVEANTLARHLFPQPTVQLTGTYVNLGRFLLSRGRPAEAEPLFLRAYALAAEAGISQTPSHAVELAAMALLTMDTERFDEAFDWLEQALAIADELLPPEHRLPSSLRLNLIQARIEAGRSDTELSEVLALVDTSESTNQRIPALLLAARLAAEQQQPDQARAALHEAHVLRPELPHAVIAERARWTWLTALAQEALGDTEAAQASFLATAAEYRDAGRDHHPRRGRALLRAALLAPADDPERQHLIDQARPILLEHLQEPAPSLALLESP